MTQHEFACKVLATADGMITTEEAMRTWWINTRNAKSLRLSQQGVECLRHLQVPIYDFGIDPKIIRQPRYLLRLDRYLACPYYINPKKADTLSLLGSDQAVMASLCGDMQRYMDNLTSQ